MGDRPATTWLEVERRFSQLVSLLPAQLDGKRAVQHHDIA